MCVCVDMMSRSPRLPPVRSVSLQMIAMASRVKSSAMLKKTNSQPSLLFYAIADFEPNDSMIGALRLERGDEVEVLKRDPSGKKVGLSVGSSSCLRCHFFEDPSYDRDIRLDT